MLVTFRRDHTLIPYKVNYVLKKGATAAERDIEKVPLIPTPKWKNFCLSPRSGLAIENDPNQDPNLPENSDSISATDIDVSDVSRGPDSRTEE